MYVSDLNHKNKTLKEKLETLYTLSRGKRLALGFRDNYIALLEALGNPHTHLPPTIHVAGTNGKGSTIAFMKAILEASGYSVHTYTSPHLLAFNERIVLNGVPIDDDTLESLIDKTLDANNGRDVTFFEITTAMAFDAFANTPADIVLLETGLGGRLDCTNIIPQAEACVITPISYDHTEFLGETLRNITIEKAGIIKNETNCITAKQPSAVMSVLQEKALKKSAPLYICEDDFSYTPPALIGNHQIQNAITAITTLRSIPRFQSITKQHIQTGLNNTSWPGRLQNITTHFHVSNQWSIIYDGGHNAGAAEALAQYIRQCKNNVHCIVGMMQGKDVQTFTDILAPHAASITAITIPNEPMALSGQSIAAHHDGIQIADSIDHAVQTITNSHDYGHILICGSLYLAQHILS